MASLFVEMDSSKPERRTFYWDNKLSSLPVNSLLDSTEKYLQSCKAVLSDAEFQKTKSIVKNFMISDGERLQKKLEQRSREHKNWLEEWWLDGYLRIRGPAACLNFSGLADYIYWPLDDQLKSSALHIHLFLEFWQLLREERLKQQTDNNGRPLSMSQFRYAFNTCRIPRHSKDEILSNFKTIYEGDCPSHVIIFYRRRLYKIQGICEKTGKVCSPHQLHKALLKIVENKEEGPGIAALTEMNRDEWASARLHLISLSHLNKATIDDIESAIMCATISEEPVKNKEEVMMYGMLKAYGHRWLDKINLICCRNSKLMVNCDHTPMDGMVIVTMITYVQAVLLSLKSTGIQKMWGDETEDFPKPLELCFTIDDRIRQYISKGYAVSRAVDQGADCRIFEFTKFGKAGLKKLGRIHPCAFVEISLQLAYMRKHGKPAPTYETSTTRMFHGGRTETLRTCTPEAVKFCEAMISDGPDKKNLFIEATRKYFKLMQDCKSGKGCDRHFLGLSMIASENGEKTPEIFTDPSYVKSGGAGNFVLSTSFIGYGTMAVGGVLPMVEDGYGAFFRMDNNAIIFFISSFYDGKGTSSERFKQYLGNALEDCYELFDSSKI